MSATSKNFEAGRLPPLNLDFQKHVSEIDLGHYSKRSRVVGIETDRTIEKNICDPGRTERPSLTAREYETKSKNLNKPLKNVSSAGHDNTENDGALWELHGLLFKPPRPCPHPAKHISGIHHDKTPFDIGGSNSSKDILNIGGGGMIILRARLGRPKRWITLSESSAKCLSGPPPSLSRPEVSWNPEQTKNSYVDLQ